MDFLLKLHSSLIGNVELKFNDFNYSIHQDSIGVVNACLLFTPDKNKANKGRENRVHIRFSVLLVSNFTTQLGSNRIATSRQERFLYEKKEEKCKPTKAALS